MFRLKNETIENTKQVVPFGTEFRLVLIAILCFTIGLLANNILCKFQNMVDNHQANIVAEISDEDSQSAYTIESQLDTLRFLQQNKWELLSESEKLQVLETVIKIEQHTLGLSHDVFLQTSKLESDAIGNYSPLTCVLSIDSDYLYSRTAEEALYVVVNQMYQAYEIDLAEMYNTLQSQYKGLLIFRDLEIYTQELTVGNSLDLSYEEYASLLTVEAAKAYAEYTVIQYLACIESISEIL